MAWQRLGVPFGSSGVADDIQNGRRVGNVEGGARAAKDLEDSLTHFGDERVDVHERLDVTTGCTGVPIPAEKQRELECRTTSDSGASREPYCRS